jgi:hypothetical protein
MFLDTGRNRKHNLEVSCEHEWFKLAMDITETDTLRRDLFSAYLKFLFFVCVKPSATYISSSDIFLKWQYISKYTLINYRNFLTQTKINTELRL